MKQNPSVITNAQISDKLLTLAHLLAAQKENPFKVKAYRRAAKTVQAMGESVSDLVRQNADLTVFSGIGPAIGGVIREIVETGTTRQLTTLESEVAPEFAGIVAHPLLDPRRVLRVYKKLGISTIDELRRSLEGGEIAAAFGPRMDQHIRRGLSEQAQMLLYEADRTIPVIRDFLIRKCGVAQAEPVGEFRRRVDVISELHFLIETEKFPEVVETLRTYGGHADLVSSDVATAVFKLASGTLLRVTSASRRQWGLALVRSTGSPEHVAGLQRVGLDVRHAYATESDVYDKLGLPFIPPELREGYDEVDLAGQKQLSALVTAGDVRGELHAHSTSSDGVDTLEDMAEAAREHGLEYIGISDHSQSLKIARGLSIERLRNQLRFIDKLNGRLNGIRILKSAEVDILEDGSLDYPDDVLCELDYTVCSIHSRFGLGREEQTVRVLRAMDNPYFTFLGHATGRLLLKRPGYELDIERILEHAKQRGCFLEINSSPDRLDLSAENARLARQAGVGVAITTDAHSTRELNYLKYGVDQARRAGLSKDLVVNTLHWEQLERLIRRLRAAS